MARLAAVGVAAGVIVALALAVEFGRRAGPGPGPSPAPSSASSPVGPGVFYEVLAADDSVLMARSLDGRSLAQVVARRPSFDYGVAWTVDLSGRLAIAQFDENGGSHLEAVDTVTGASRWDVDAPVVDLGLGVWSSDGSRFAATTEPEEDTLREAVIVDVANGTVQRVSIPPDPDLQGFDSDGALVMRERLTDVLGQTLGWRFLRIDPATTTIEQLPVPPAIGPRTNGSDDVDPETGIGLEGVPREDGTATDLRVWSLARGKPQIVATFESVDTIALDPGGRLAAVGVGQASVVIASLDGHSSPVWTGQGRGDVSWSAGGDYLGVNSWDGTSRIDIIELSTGRVIGLPLPTAIAQASLLRIVGGFALPEAALPAAEPTPPASAGPSGPDVGPDAAIIAGHIDQSGDHSILQVEQVVPTEQGGLRTAAAMDPVDLGETPDLGAAGESGEEATRLALLPRPGSPDILVWVDSPAGTRAWLWAPGGDRRDLSLPAGWPARTSDISWRPDGLALAAAGYEPNVEGAARPGFVIGTLGGGTKWLDPPPDYDRLQGWWTQDELLVGHGICTEGCPGRYSFSARLAVANGSLHQFSATDHGRLPIHTWYIDEDGQTIVLTAVNEDTANDIRIEWPPSLPTEGGVDVIGWSSDGRSLLVTARTANGPGVYRIDDPVGRAREGRLVDPAPVRIGSLPNGGAVVVSPDGAWAVVSDRTGSSQLVELASGRAWPIDSSATLAWPDGD
jgi:hypothetical protein